MNRSVIVALIVFVIVVGGIFLFNKNVGAPVAENNTETVNPTPTQTETDVEVDVTPEVTVPQTVEVSMTDAGYVPSVVTIKKGDIVKFTNNGTKSNWPASAPHPTHTDYPAFDPKKGVAVGESWSFTFDQVGRWPFHNHLNSTRFGAIIVTE